MDMLKKLDSDIKLGSMKQFSAFLLVEDNTLDALNWTSEFAGRWEDNRTADEVVEDIRGARTSNREIDLYLCISVSKNIKKLMIEIWAER